MNLNTYNGFDLSKLSDIKKFAKHCNRAIRECPQECNSLSILKNKYVFDNYTPSEVFKWYRNNNVLWPYGYSKYLSDKAKATFQRYVLIPSVENIEHIMVYDIYTEKYLSNERFQDLFKY